MSYMSATQLTPAPSGQKSLVTSPFLNSPQRRRVSEADMGNAIADWFAGGPWSLEDAQWARFDRAAIRLRQQGEKLTLHGITIATRNPPGVPEAEPGTNLPHFSDARAVARVALRGDHERLYGPRPK
jgi:hypothetical protein